MHASHVDSMAVHFSVFRNCTAFSVASEDAIVIDSLVLHLGMQLLLTVEGCRNN